MAPLVLSSGLPEGSFLGLQTCEAGAAAALWPALRRSTPSLRGSPDRDHVTQLLQLLQQLPQVKQQLRPSVNLGNDIIQGRKNHEFLEPPNSSKSSPFNYVESHKLDWDKKRIQEVYERLFNTVHNARNENENHFTYKSSNSLTWIKLTYDAWSLLFFFKVFYIFMHLILKQPYEVGPILSLFYEDKSWGTERVKFTCSRS